MNKLLLIAEFCKQINTRYEYQEDYHLKNDFQFYFEGVEVNVIFCTHRFDFKMEFQKYNANLVPQKVEFENMEETISTCSIILQEHIQSLSEQPKDEIEERGNVLFFTEL